MPYTTIVTGTSITSSWANTNVRDQVVSQFANATARDAAIASGSRVAGMACALTDADADNGLWVYNGTTWRKPWNMPWGILGIGTVSSDQSLASTSVADITGLSATSVPFLANRYYRATLSMYITGNATTANRFTSLTLTNGAGSTTFGTFSQQSVVALDNMSYCSTATFTTSAVTGTVKVRYILAGTDTIKVKGGTGTSSVSELVIEDLGPAGAPS